MSPIFENQTGNVNSRRTDQGPDKERKDAGNDSVEKKRQTNNGEFDPGSG